MNETPAPDPLAVLIQESQFIGWTCQLDYETAVVLTNDLWKARARGVPLNCFLLATPADFRKTEGRGKISARNHSAPGHRLRAAALG